MLFESECEECSLNKWLTITKISEEVRFQGNEGKGRMQHIKDKDVILGSSESLGTSIDLLNIKSTQRPKEGLEGRSMDKKPS